MRWGTEEFLVCQLLKKIRQPYSEKFVRKKPLFKHVGQYPGEDMGLYSRIQVELWHASPKLWPQNPLFSCFLDVSIHFFTLRLLLVYEAPRLCTLNSASILSAGAQHTQKRNFSACKELNSLNVRVFLHDQASQIRQAAAVAFSNIAEGAREEKELGEIAITHKNSLLCLGRFKHTTCWRVVATSLVQADTLDVTAEARHLEDGHNNAHCGSPFYETLWSLFSLPRLHFTTHATKATKYPPENSTWKPIFF